MSIEPGAPSTGASFLGGLAVLGFLAAMLLVFAVLFGMVRASAETQLQTFRDDKGRITGQATTRGNTTTFENSRGQNTGRAERHPDGTIIFFDDKGRMIGSSSGSGIGRSK
jgi:hypothetical protein